MNTEETKPSRKLKNINVFEVSFVDKAANGQKFIMWKNEEGLKIPLETDNNINKVDNNKGGDNMNKDIEVTKTETIPEVTDAEKLEKLAEINKSLPKIDWENPEQIAALEKQFEKGKKERESFDNKDNNMTKEIVKEAAVKSNEELIKTITETVTKSVTDDIMTKLEPLLPRRKAMDTAVVGKRDESTPKDEATAYIEKAKTEAGRSAATHATAPNPIEMVKKIWDGQKTDKLRVQD